MATEHTSESTNTAKRAKRSWGEWLFDVGVYGGMNYVGTFLITLPVAFQAKYGVCKEAFKWCASQMHRSGLSENTAEQFLITTATMQGGNIMVPFIKMAENRKEQIVECLNKTVGDETDISGMKDAPKQTWGSLGLSRALAWTTVFASFMAATHIWPQKFQVLEQGFAKRFCDMLKLPLKEMKKQANGKMEMVDSGWFNLGKIAAIDTFATAAAVSLLYIGSRFFAVIKPKEATNDLPELPALPEKEKSAPATPEYKPHRRDDTLAMSHGQRVRTSQAEAPSLTHAV